MLRSAPGERHVGAECTHPGVGALVTAFAVAGSTLGPTAAEAVTAPAPEGPGCG